MKKKWHGTECLMFFQEKKWRKSIGAFLQWLSDWIVELLCDYGESIWRVLGWLLILVFIIGPLSLILAGGLVWNGSNTTTYFALKNELTRFLYSYFQYLLYMLDTITTANFSEMHPINDVTRLLSGIMASIGIFLLGLLGFVAGNRIRNS
jgi:predicted PurR-regulated permease PerM